MSLNDTYELFGGVLYNTPVDETSDEIISENFIKAREIADEFLSVRSIREIPYIVIKIDVVVLNYMNSPFIDFFIDQKKHRDCYLACAAAWGLLNIVKYLVSKGADVHEDDDISLMYAAQDGKTDVVKYLVSIGADVNARNGYALQRASMRGHFDIVKCLVEAGANVHANEHTALYWACIGNHFDVIKYLESKGAKLKEKPHQDDDDCCIS